MTASGTQETAHFDDWRLNPKSRKNVLGRALWEICWLTLFRTSPRFRAFAGWRRGLLRLFGGKIAASAMPYPSARIWAPWNLEMGERSVLSERSQCYCVAPVRLADDANLGPEAFLCAATRDISRLDKPLVIGAISIESHGWVCTRAFVGPNVCVGTGAVVGACAVVMKNVPAWTVVAGNPARELRPRTLQSSADSPRDVVPHS